jgi:signal transduction histidine kinase
LLARQGLRPVREVTEAAQRNSASNLKERLSSRGTGDEMDRLIETFNDMIGRLDESVTRISQFTADASHELRTPLSVIEAQTSLALAGSREADADRRALERIDGESRRIRRILEDLLWLARFDALRGAPDAEPVDVGVLAAGAADRFSVVAAARGLAIDVRVAPGDHVVSIPPDWLDRLLGVLLDNACKLAPDGSTVRVAVGGSGGRVVLAVDDAGPGIPAEERERIFDRFHRASSTGSGAGLGLAIADGIVRATQGRWAVGTSDLGGASMSVSWPRALAERAGRTADGS